MKETLVVKWSPETVREFILGCRKDEGIPMFKSLYAKHPILFNGKPAVLAVCWGGRGKFRDSFFFTDVPEDDLKLIEGMTGDWRFLIRKYGTKKDVIEAESHGVYIPGYDVFIHLKEK